MRIMPGHRPCRLLRRPAVGLAQHVTFPGLLPFSWFRLVVLQRLMCYMNSHASAETWPATKAEPHPLTAHERDSDIQRRSRAAHAR